MRVLLKQKELKYHLTSLPLLLLPQHHPITNLPAQSSKPRRPKRKQKAPPNPTPFDSAPALLGQASLLKVSIIGACATGNGVITGRAKNTCLLIPLTFHFKGMHLIKEEKGKLRGTETAVLGGGLIMHSCAFLSHFSIFAPSPAFRFMLQSVHGGVALK